MTQAAGLDARLDRQVWNMLEGRLAHLAQGTAAAFRIDPRYGPFAALRDDGEEAARDLVALLRGDGDEVWFVETGPVAAPQGMVVRRTRQLTQMLAQEEAAPDEVEDAEVVPIGDDFADQMTALALETKPGPWGTLTHRYGPFYGILRDGRLAAMAGQRMLPCDGVCEVSAVCTWPEFQGQGLGNRLIRHVMATIRARGERPYLHTYADNAVAIALYRKLGFVERREMTVTVMGAA